MAPDSVKSCRSDRSALAKCGLVQAGIWKLYLLKCAFASGAPAKVHFVLVQVLKSIATATVARRSSGRIDQFPSPIMLLLLAVVRFPKPQDHRDQHRSPTDEFQDLEDRQAPAPVHQPFQCPLDAGEARPRCSHFQSSQSSVVPALPLPPPEAGLLHSGARCGQTACPSPGSPIRLNCRPRADETRRPWASMTVKKILDRAA